MVLHFRWQALVYISRNECKPMDVDCGGEKVSDSALSIPRLNSQDLSATQLQKILSIPQYFSVNVFPRTKCSIFEQLHRAPRPISCGRLKMFWQITKVSASSVLCHCHCNQSYISLSSHHYDFLRMKDFRKPTIKVSTNNIECGWGKLSKGWKPARVGPGNYTPITSRSRVTFLQKTTVCAYKRVSLHNTCWLKYSTRWRQWCFQCRCCLAYEGLASAGDEGAIVGSCIDEGKNRKCVFQNIKFAEDSSSEMVRQQSFKSVFYFELWVDRLVLSVWPAKYNFRV